MALLTVKDLKVSYINRRTYYQVVRGVSYDLNEGEVLGVVGESGSGKSVTHYALMGLIPQPPGRIDSGNAYFQNLDLLNCDKESLRKIRGKKISMIFQDPMTCLNPYLKIGTQLIEPLLVHDQLNKFDATKKAEAILKEVGIVDAQNRLNSYPHQFSGGMRQRIMIAMALITDPQLLIADEPTTALDVTVEAQILDLIRKKQKERGMAVIFISHNLGVVAGFADRVLVMYAGKIVESAATSEIFYRSKHPYTQALLSSLPASHKKGEQLFTIPGIPPDLGKPLPGCSFAPRCHKAQNECLSGEMSFIQLAAQHESACLRYQNGGLVS